MVDRSALCSRPEDIIAWPQWTIRNGESRRERGIAKPMLDMMDDGTCFPVVVGINPKPTRGGAIPTPCRLAEVKRPSWQVNS